MAPSLNTAQAAEYLGLSPTTLEKLRCAGTGPKFAKLGRAVRYRSSDLEEYLNKRMVSSTSERVAA